jgi:aryl-alcohol dehydrogenase-like predicted oxidoreductase
MEHVQLARTGVSVSRFCLGAMMFGGWGNHDHDESIRIIHEVESSLRRLATAWLDLGQIHRPDPDPITAPIIGPRSTEDLESRLAAADVVLDETLLNRTDDRPAWQDDQPSRQLLGQPGARVGGAGALSPRHVPACSSARSRCWSASARSR